jgi:hypothetical protein
LICGDHRRRFCGAVERRRVRAQPARRVAAAERGHAFPEQRRFFGVVAGADRVAQPEHVGFGFVARLNGSMHADLRAAPSTAITPARASSLMSAMPSPACTACIVPSREHALRHALAAVAQHRVRDLVAHHDRQPVLVLRDRQDAGVDGDAAVRQAERVRVSSAFSSRTSHWNPMLARGFELRRSAGRRARAAPSRSPCPDVTRPCLVGRSS